MKHWMASTLALMAAAMPLAALAQVEVSGSTAIDQISLPDLSAQQIESDQVALSADSAPSLTQLPEGLEPVASANEDQLGETAAPPRSLTRDVLVAWETIRGRGQTPTPDLVAREIGPDRLAEFLATVPAAGNILATGTDPDTVPVSPVKGDGSEGAVVNFIPPPGQS